MIRPLRPTDLGAFLAFRERLPPNEACLRPGAAPTRTTLREFAGRALALEPGRESWVQIEHGHIHGIISARARFGADVWDIDQLIVLPAVDAERVGARLIEHLCNAAVEEGIQKVFLRLHDDSPMLAVARQAGFLLYAGETIVAAPERPLVRREAIGGLRPRRPVDHQALFHLYCAIVPVAVRQVEAMTLQEWRWIDGWGIRGTQLRDVLAGSRRDFVLQGEAGVLAWVQVEGRQRVISLLVDPRVDADVTRLCRRTIAELPPGGPVTCTIRDYQAGLQEALAELGFRPVIRHALLARAMAVRVPEAKLLPVRA